ncbi:MAG TPA: DUF2889 domain-containing protein [Stellaceae bacterium]|nr:DUF2889 domain-containing protein [Stellaceae bacterium]
MPLSPPCPREHIHTRVVECRGYLRTDGLWDVEGHITDVKTYAFTSEFRGEVSAGMPVHDMWLRLTVDDRLTIHEVEAVTDAAPYSVCPAAAETFRRLKGLDIRAGFRKRIRELIGGTEGCTHLLELLGPIATTAYQTVYPYRERRRAERQAVKTARAKGRKPSLIDSCHAFASDGEVVKRYWPEFYTGDERG